MTFPSPALDRFCAGGRHIRLLIAGQPPDGLVLPPLDHFDRVVHLAHPGHTGPIVADPQRLPFTEALFDRALVTSPLPANAARAELREIWRTLAPAGLALLVIKARRPWQATGWRREDLEPVIEDAMFELLAWEIETLPDRHHLILVGKRDGLRPAMVGRTADSLVPAAA